MNTLVINNVLDDLERIDKCGECAHYLTIADRALQVCLRSKEHVILLLLDSRMTSLKDGRDWVYVRTNIPCKHRLACEYVEYLVPTVIFSFTEMREKA